MAKGRKPLPTTLKAVKGTNRPDRENKDAPPVSGIPQPPKWLSVKELSAWKTEVPRLIKMGVVSESDSLALAMLCQKRVEWSEATRAVNTEGFTVNAPSGYPIQNPNLAIANTAFKHLQSMLAEFGMTASSRQRVSSDKPKKPGDPTAKYFT